MAKKRPSSAGASLEAQLADLERHLAARQEEEARRHAEPFAPPADPWGLVQGNKALFHALARRAARLLDCLVNGRPAREGLEDAVRRGREQCHASFHGLLRGAPQVRCLHPPGHQFPGFPGPGNGPEAVLLYAQSVLAEAGRRRGDASASSWDDVAFDVLRQLPPAWATDVIGHDFSLLEQCLREAPGPADRPGGPGRPEDTLDPDGRDQAPRSRKGIPLAEAEIRVHEWLKKNAKDNPAGVTRDAVAAGTGVSTGMVSKTAVWKAFRDRRDAATKPGAREIPLTEAMLTAIPADGALPDELDALIEKQAREKAEDERFPERRHRRRHEPS
jgi:hypothetical protein